MKKTQLSFWQILNMNVGFLGIQFSFGLQQSNMSPIYNYLGADEASLPYLWLAGPITGLVVQPIVGAMSDRTTNKYGRRTPYFLIGALLCSLGLFFMPLSPTLWMAASLLWILDAANNVTMEPYRAYVSDKLEGNQVNTGFLVQSAFTGLGQTLAYVTPAILVMLGMNKHWVNSHNIPHMTIVAFMIGAVLSVVTIVWSVLSCPEEPLSRQEIDDINKLPKGIGSLLRDIVSAFQQMPSTLKQMLPMMLFQWYAMFCYWQYITLSISQTFFGTTVATTDGFREASLINSKIGGFYNFIAFIAAFLMIPIVRKIGPKYMHSLSLIVAGVAVFLIPSIHDESLLFVPMLGIGIAWASMMGNPYAMLSSVIPSKKIGIYMGIFNMFIVIPMLIQIVTLPLYYKTVLSGNPENVIRLAGILLCLAAISTLLIKSSGRDLENK